MPNVELTDRQTEVLAFLRRHPRASIREIRQHFGWKSTNAVADVLGVLERKGAIKRSGFKARSIEVVDDIAREDRAVLIQVAKELRWLASHTDALGVASVKAALAAAADVLGKDIE